MNRFNMPLLVLLFSTTLFPCAATVEAAQRRPDGGRGLNRDLASDRVSPALEQRFNQEVARNLAMLRLQGRLPVITKNLGSLAWPLGPVPGPGMDWHGISNFVDLSAGSAVLDYTCSNRSYDSHRGTDFFLWPFSWTTMDAGSVDIRAAAAGTIIAKGDGNPDRSCSFSAADTPNYVFIQHADGTVARYLHMKTSSVTSKAIGETIVAGEVLGKVGSSGVSTGPHLHFEVRASSAANAAVIEPANGTCNVVSSGWAGQRPYRDPKINRLSTHSLGPVNATCPATVDQPFFKNSFNPGDAIVFNASYRDQGPGQVAQFRVIRPDNSVFANWSLDSGTTFNASYWYWNYTLPADAPHGVWTFESVYQGSTKRHNFQVGTSTPPIVDPRGLVGAWYEPASSGQGMEVHWLDGDVLLVFFYAHHDNGQNFFLLGQRDGRFNYGQTLNLALYSTLGGRYTDFNPNNIVRADWGTMRLTFNSCTQAVAEVSGLDGDKTIILSRLGRMAGLNCE